MGGVPGVTPRVASGDAGAGRGGRSQRASMASSGAVSLPNFGVPWAHDRLATLLNSEGRTFGNYVAVTWKCVLA